MKQVKESIQKAARGSKGSASATFQSILKATEDDSPVKIPLSGRSMATRSSPAAEQRKKPLRLVHYPNPKPSGEDDDVVEVVADQPNKVNSLFVGDHSICLTHLNYDSFFRQ